jgi:hypothetical protein
MFRYARITALLWILAGLVLAGVGVATMARAEQQGGIGWTVRSSSAAWSCSVRCERFGESAWRCCANGRAVSQRRAAPFRRRRLPLTA